MNKRPCLKRDRWPRPHPLLSSDHTSFQHKHTQWEASSAQTPCSARVPLISQVLIIVGRPQMFFLSVQESKACWPAFSLMTHQMIVYALGACDFSFHKVHVCFPLLILKSFEFENNNKKCSRSSTLFHLHFQGNQSYGDRGYTSHAPLKHQLKIWFANTF